MLNKSVEFKFNVNAGIRDADSQVPTVMRLANWFHKWRIRRNTIHQLSALTNHQLEDIGIQRSEIAQVVDGMIEVNHQDTFRNEADRVERCKQYIEAGLAPKVLA